MRIHSSLKFSCYNTSDTRIFAIIEYQAVNLSTQSKKKGILQKQGAYGEKKIEEPSI